MSTYSVNITMLSVWYILILSICTMEFTKCVKLKNKKSKKEDLRVLRGRDALPGEYPYVLAIEWEKIRNNSKITQAICTCACIKPTWSLTAAHCIVSMKSLTELGFNFFLRYNPSHTEVAHAKVLSMVINPNYETSIFQIFAHNDIGVLKSENIAVSSYARVSSVDYSTLYGLKIAAVGYGLTTDNEGGLNNTIALNKTLQVVDAMILKCKFNLFPKYCLAGVCNKTWTPLCPGDSGGPVIHSSGIVGINTASLFRFYREEFLIKDNEIKKTIGIITAVSPFIDWIVNVIK